MDTFNIGDIVTLSEDHQKDPYEIYYLDTVKEAFGGQTPIGIVCMIKSHNIICVNWGTKSNKFHTCFGVLSNCTGYNHRSHSLRKIYTEYDPNQEPEDDCL